MERESAEEQHCGLPDSLRLSTGGASQCIFVEYLRNVQYPSPTSPLHSRPDRSGTWIQDEILTHPHVSTTETNLEFKAAVAIRYIELDILQYPHSLWPV